MNIPHNITADLFLGLLRAIIAVLLTTGLAAAGHPPGCPREPLVITFAQSDPEYQAFARDLQTSPTLRRTLESRFCLHWQDYWTNRENCRAAGIHKLTFALRGRRVEGYKSPEQLLQLLGSPSRETAPQDRPNRPLTPPQREVKPASVPVSRKDFASAVSGIQGRHEQLLEQIRRDNVTQSGERSEKSRRWESIATQQRDEISKNSQTISALDTRAQKLEESSRSTQGYLVDRESVIDDLLQRLSRGQSNHTAVIASLHQASENTAFSDIPEPPEGGSNQPAVRPPSRSRLSEKWSAVARRLVGVGATIVAPEVTIPAGVIAMAGFLVPLVIRRVRNGKQRRRSEVRHQDDFCGVVEPGIR